MSIQFRFTPGLLVVCAWCHPGQTIFDKYPEWKALNLKLSHGVCADHKAQVEREIRMKKFQQATVRGTAESHKLEQRGATPRPVTTHQCPVEAKGNGAADGHAAANADIAPLPPRFS